MRYDPLGRLYETSGGAAGITRFLYDGDEVVAEYSGSGAMLRRYVHGSGNDDPMAWFEGESIDANVAKLIKTNHQGSVIALTDGQGNLTDINSYDEWGIPAPTNTGRFQYTGQAWIPELRMYHYKARIYSPTLGRFLQTDPIGYDDQVNLYAYVGNDPVNGTDPDGMARNFIGDPCDSKGGGAKAISSCSGESLLAVTANASDPKTRSGNGNSQTPPGRGGTFSPPTNPPTEPPFIEKPSPGSRGGAIVGKGPNGTTIRAQPASPATASRGYPNGYWRMYDKNGRLINPASGKQPGAGGNITKAQFAGQTHVPLPENSKYNSNDIASPGRAGLRFFGRLGGLLACILLCEAPVY